MNHLTIESTRIVREIHRLGIAPFADVLRAMSVLGINAAQLRRRMNHLSELGWIENVGGATGAARWSVSAAALRLLPSDGPLPVDPLCASAPQPVPEPAPRHAGAPTPPPQYDCIRAPAYQPAPSAPMRPGADDHRRHASHGWRC